MGVLPGEPELSLAQALSPATLADAPLPRTLAAGPHSAPRNLRGSNAVVFWAVGSSTPLRWSDTLYAPNLAGGVEAPLVTQA